MNLTQLPSGTWRVAVKHGGQRRTKAGFRTKKEARSYGATLMREIDDALPANAVRRRRVSGHTVGHLVDRVTEQAIDPRTGKAWSATYVEQITFTFAVDALPAWFLEMEVARVDVADVDGLYAKLAKLPASKVRRIHRLLSVCWTWGQRWGWVRSNPVRLATPPPEPSRAVHPPSPADLAVIVAKINEDPQFAAYVRMAWTTGARRGELVALRWADVNLDVGAVTIARALSWTKAGGLAVKEVKTGAKGERVVALDDATVAMLRAWRAVQAGRWEEAVRPEAFIFGRLDRPHRPNWATHRWVDLCKEAGVRCRLNDLRHFSASQLIGAGVDVVTVAGRLGHTSARTTLSVYAHFLPERDREAADVIARRLG